MYKRGNSLIKFAIPEITGTVEIVRIIKSIIETNIVHHKI